LRGFAATGEELGTTFLVIWRKMAVSKDTIIQTGVTFLCADVCSFEESDFSCQHLWNVWKALKCGVKFSEVIPRGMIRFQKSLVQRQVNIRNRPPKHSALRSSVMALCPKNFL